MIDMRVLQGKQVIGSVSHPSDIKRYDRFDEPPTIHPDDLRVWNEHQARAAINEWRDAAQDAGFEHDGKPFDSDEKSRTELNGLVNKAQLMITLQGDTETKLPWITGDNEEIEVTPTEAIALGEACGTRHSTLQIGCFRIKQQLTEMADEDLQSIIDNAATAVPAMLGLK